MLYSRDVISKTIACKPMTISATQCSTGTLVSGVIKFIRIFAGVLWKGGVKRQWDRTLTHALHIGVAISQWKCDVTVTEFIDELAYGISYCLILNTVTCHNVAPTARKLALVSKLTLINPISYSGAVWDGLSGQIRWSIPDAIYRVGSERFF